MDILKEFLIPFSGLKLGKHQFEFQVNNTFFTHFGYDEFNDSNIKMNVVLEKKSNMLELNFSHKGTINVPCDLTNEDFDLPIKGKISERLDFDKNKNWLLIELENQMEYEGKKIGKVLIKNKDAEKSIKLKEKNQIAHLRLVTDESKLLTKELAEFPFVDWIRCE